MVSKSEWVKVAHGSFGIPGATATGSNPPPSIDDQWDEHKGRIQEELSLGADAGSITHVVRDWVRDHE